MHLRVTHGLGSPASPQAGGRAPRRPVGDVVRTSRLRAGDPGFRDIQGVVCFSYQLQPQRRRRSSLRLNYIAQQKRDRRAAARTFFFTKRKNERLDFFSSSIRWYLCALASLLISISLSYY
jgi:hypothetical protein